MKVVGETISQVGFTVAALSVVAVVSFIFGRSIGRRKEKFRGEGEAQRKARNRDAPDVVGQPVEYSEEELVRFLLQLPSRPLCPREQGEVHSTVRAVLLCASGKGGVGKSTVSVNLAYALHGFGLTVGLLDLDIYGPSLPELIRLPPNSAVKNEQGRVVPLGYGGVGVMSYGYIAPGQAATIRAPIANSLVQQLLTNVEWGELDVLVVDTPPGTGDVLLTLSQTLQVDGAVLVTTGNALSLVDVAKGLQLFEKVDIPTLLVVLNMASMCCNECRNEQQLFIDGAIAGLPGLLEIRQVPLVKLPLDPVLSRTPSGYASPQLYEYPFIRNPDYDDRPASHRLHQMALAALQGLLGVSRGGSGAGQEGDTRRGSASSLRLRTDGRLELRLAGGELHPLTCGQIRAQCRCAFCVDEFTGEVKIDRGKFLNDSKLRAERVEAVGNYAVSVLSSDGHQSVVALKALEALGASADAGGATARREGQVEW